MQPIQYLPQPADPMQKALIGLQIGESISNTIQQSRERERQQQVLVDYQKDLQTTMQNPTAEAFGQLALKYPGQREAIVASSKLMTDAQQTSALNDASKIFNALELGNKDAALKIATIKRDALKNAGRNAEDYDAIIEAINTNPQAAKATVGLIGSSIDPKKWTETFKAAPEVSEAKSKAEKAAIEARFAEQLAQAGLTEKNWNVRNIQSQINERAAKLKIDAQIAQATVAEKLASASDKLQGLPEHAQKLVNESAVSAASAKQSASQYENLASQLDTLKGSWGAFNTLGEWTKKTFGEQDLRTAIQGEYTRLANSAAIKAYKAAGASGGFSDADLNTALAGIPPPNANPSVMASFMRGMAKAQQIAAAADDAKTDWLVNNRGVLGRSNKDFSAGGYTVKAGENYSDFISRISEDVSKKSLTKSPPQPKVPSPQDIDALIKKYGG